MSDLWSRRRAAVAREREAEARADAQAATAARDAELEAMPEADALAALGLPDPDTMEKGGDFAAFLRDGVPGWLRTRALRRLWRVNPALANLDGMVDYGGNYTDSATVVPHLTTAYQVGRGMARHVAALDDVGSGLDGEAAGGENPPMGNRGSADAAPEREQKLPDGKPWVGGADGASSVDAADGAVSGGWATPTSRRMAFAYDAERPAEPEDAA